MSANDPKRTFALSACYKPRALVDGSADSHAHTAVSHDYRAHDEARAIRREERDEFGDLLRLRGAADWSLSAMVCKEGLSVIQLTPPNIRYHVANADSVNPNTVLNRLQRKRSRQLYKRPFR